MFVKSLQQQIKRTVLLIMKIAEPSLFGYIKYLPD